MVCPTKCPNCDYQEALHYTEINVIYCPECGYREERP